jgi:hypothetical protein
LASQRWQAIRDDLNELAPAPVLTPNGLSAATG